MLSLLVCAVTGMVFDTVVLGRLRGGSPLAKLLASLGLLLTLQAFVLVRFGSTGQTGPSGLFRVARLLGPRIRAVRAR